VEGLIARIYRNRDGVVEASKAFLRGRMGREEYLSILERFRSEQSEAVRQLLCVARQMNPVRRARTLMVIAADNRLTAIAQAVRSVLNGEVGRWAALVLEERFSLTAPLAAAPEQAPATPQPPGGEASPAIPESEAPTPALEMLEASLQPSHPESEPQPALQREGTLPEATPQPEAPAERRERITIRIEGVRAAVARALSSVAQKSSKGPVHLYRELDDLLALKDLNRLEEQLIYLSKLLLMCLMGEVDLNTARELGEDYGSKIRELMAKGHRVREQVATKVMEAVRASEERQDVRDLALLVSLAAGQPLGRVEGARACSSSSS